MNIPVALVIGFALGLITTVVAVVLTMRSSMIVPERSSKSFEATCAAIEKVVPGNDGWSFPMESFDMSAKLAAKDAMPANVKRIRLYFMCKPDVAKKVLGANPKLSAIMPCSWSVYELDDGSVWVSHMNIGMMAKMMGGVVGESMGGVAKADKRFLEAILH
ncbi:MAG: DUF302 domain-containing protein [Thermoanaerobaculales bacterium]|jgi:uncharacterized protein (DUF302 family)|nr:DUF302 domain-containing protein [Thermoanaerobaculales bacterium]